MTVGTCDRSLGSTLPTTVDTKTIWICKSFRLRCSVVTRIANHAFARFPRVQTCETCTWSPEEKWKPSGPPVFPDVRWTCQWRATRTYRTLHQKIYSSSISAAQCWPGTWTRTSNTWLHTRCVSEKIYIFVHFPIFLKHIIFI